MKTYQILLLNFFVLCSLSCQEQWQRPTFIYPGNEQINYEGRIGLSDSLAELFWPGTQIEVNFKGTRLRAIFQDTKGDNYYNVLVDNDSMWIMRPDTFFNEYILAQNLEDKEHNIKIYKRTEWNRGTTQFYGFKLDRGDELLDAPSPKKRKMEFYGNSITAGYGVEDTSGKDRPGGTFTNNYLTYAAVTARHFNAQCHYIVRSGIGVMMSWVPQIMPEIYDLTDPLDATSTWDFASYQPDVVVVNLFQNDSWLVKLPKNKEYKRRLGEGFEIDDKFIINSYIRFVWDLRKKYPKAHIICMLGNMSITKKDSKWPWYIEKAVETMDDAKMYTLFVPYKETSGHPSIKEQQEMADQLIGFIEGNIKW